MPPKQIEWLLAKVAQENNDMERGDSRGEHHARSHGS